GVQGAKGKESRTESQEPGTMGQKKNLVEINISTWNRAVCRHYFFPDSWLLILDSSPLSLRYESLRHHQLQHS
ncbi:MAG: hypothetical protein ACHQIM_17550, partial [Sphingobacteriales bacterium]